MAPMNMTVNCTEDGTNCTKELQHVPELSNVDETVYFAVAFLFGFVALKFELPPMVGFIAAGFALNGFDFQPTETIEVLSQLGITLLLFTIGLKLNPKHLIKLQIWLPATLHIIITSLLFSVLILFFGLFNNIPILGGLDYVTTLLIGFAFSFSSTVFAVKVLEEYGEMATFNGKLSIGILVMQDIFAVLFLAFATGKVPNAYSLCLLGLPLARHIMWWVLDHSRHGEIMTLYGLSVSLVAGYQLFEFCGLKGDLGSLVIGMLIRSHHKASELSKSLVKIKDILLVGFFLEIGLKSSLTLDAVYIALLFMLFLPMKIFLYYVLTNAVYLRARTSLLVCLALANYSEFGLIVINLAVKEGYVENEFLTVMAISVSLTFAIASPMNTYANDIYIYFRRKLKKFQRSHRLEEEELNTIGPAKVIILGMGRIGEQVYLALLQHGYDERELLGVDVNAAALEESDDFAPSNIIMGDASDPDFWDGSDFSNVELLVFALPKHSQNVHGIQQLVRARFFRKHPKWKGKVAVLVKYEHELKELKKHYGIDIIYNTYIGTGIAFGKHIVSETQKFRSGASILTKRNSKPDIEMVEAAVVPE